MGQIERFDRGSAVIQEVEFKEDSAFGTPAYFDPDSPVITVTDPAGTYKVLNAALIKSDTGKWYYLCQTGVDWITGVYSVKVSASNGSYSDVTINRTSFRLV